MTTVNVDTQRISSFVRQAAALAAIVVANINAVPIPSGDRAWLTLAGGALLAVEHYLSDPSTGTPVVAAPAVETVKAVNPINVPPPAP